MTDTVTHAPTPSRSTVRLSPRVTADLILGAECLTVFVSAILAKQIYVYWLLGSPEPIEKYIYHAIVAAIAFGYFAMGQKLYAVKVLSAPQKELLRVVAAFGISLLALVVIGYLFKFAHEFSRGWMLTWLGLGALLLIFERMFFGRLFSWLVTSDYFGHRIAVVGEADAATALIDNLAISKPGVRLAGVFTMSDMSESRLSANDLVRLGQQNAFDEIYVLASANENNDLRRVLDRLRVLPLPIKVCPSELDLGAPIRECEAVGSLTAFSIQNKPISEWGIVLKTIEDYVLSALALVVLSPLFLLVALAIKLDTRGPVFFRQRRHGFNHKEINVWKFRTMTVQEDGDEIRQATRNDHRITLVGRFLRRTSIDELPQLINVLRGEMSLVGPRPHAVAHNKFYSKLFETYGTRHRVKPGITGWAQVNGFRGPTEDPHLMRQRVVFDQYYIENWSLLLDLKILLLTPICTLVGENAH